MIAAAQHFLKDCWPVIGWVVIAVIAVCIAGEYSAVWQKPTE